MVELIDYMLGVQADPGEQQLVREVSPMKERLLVKFARLAPDTRQGARGDHCCFFVVFFASTKITPNR